MKRTTSLFATTLTLTLALAACGSQQQGPTTTTDWETGDSGDSNSSSTGDTSSDEGFNPICLPGTQMCAEDGSVDICADTGLEWLNDPCPKYTECKTCIGEDDPLCEGLDARCAGPCDVDQRPASSEGCSFVATRLLFVRPGHAQPHSLFVGNNDIEDRDATVDFYLINEGTREEVLQETQVIAPGAVYQFELAHPPIMTGSSLLRTGGIYRIKSDVPVTAVQMAPHPPNNRHPDTSLLLPEEAERQDFVVPGAPGKGLLNPNDADAYSGYVTIIALEDDTEVEWKSNHTALFGNGAPMPAAEAGETVSVKMNRYDNMRISAVQNPDVPRWDNWDVSGLVVHSTKPISMFSGSNCGSYPDTSRTCDHMQEQVFPLTYWGQEYVAPSSPDRVIQDLSEPPLADPPEQRTYWRVFAGADDTTVLITPPVENLPTNMAGTASEIHLDKRGDYELFSAAQGVHLNITGDKAFLPVQYMQSWAGGGPLTSSNGKPDAWAMDFGGDPSMCQMVPTEQWLDNYTFLVTGRIEREFVQVIRRTGDADVTLYGPGANDETVITGWQTVGQFEIAEHALDPSTEADYRIASEDDFGLIQTGDHVTTIDTEPAASSSYCHPGGIRIVDIFAP